MYHFDPLKLVKASIVSMLATAPLIVWMILADQGYLGDFRGTRAFDHVTIGLMALTGLLFLLVIFLVWPRVFNGPVEKEESRSAILSRGRAGRGILRSLGLRGKKVSERGVAGWLQVMSVEVLEEGGAYTVEKHLDLVPERLMPYLSEGMELPLMISRDERTRLAVNWRPLLERYPETPLPEGFRS